MKRITVLVIEDSAPVRATICDFLSISNPECDVLQASNGEEGIRLAQTETPDLILLDAEMPVMNGCEAAKILRRTASTKSIPLVAISSADGRNEIAVGLRTLCDRSLPKPFTIQELSDLIGKYYPPLPAYPG